MLLRPLGGDDILPLPEDALPNLREMVDVRGVRGDRAVCGGGWVHFNIFPFIALLGAFFLCVPLQ
jgi:hypothetical protein